MIAALAGEIAVGKNEFCDIINFLIFLGSIYLFQETQLAKK